MDIFSELKNAQLENLSTDLTPSPNAKGRIYHKSTTEPLKVDDGTTIHKVLTDQMYSSIATNLPAGSLTIEQIGFYVAVLSDVKASGVSGGAGTGGVWADRTLNTESDPSGIVTLASNEFTLGAGKYLIDASVPAYASFEHKAKLVNVTDGTDDIIGTTEYSYGTDAVTTRSKIEGLLDLAGTKTFKIQHYTGSSSADVLGRAAGIASTDEVYTTVKITKIG